MHFLKTLSWPIQFFCNVSFSKEGSTSKELSTVFLSMNFLSAGHFVALCCGLGQIKQLDGFLVAKHFFVENIKRNKFIV